jgi:hypothetical protein
MKEPVKMSVDIQFNFGLVNIHRKGEVEFNDTRVTIEELEEIIKIYKTEFEKL